MFTISKEFHFCAWIHSDNRGDPENPYIIIVEFQSSFLNKREVVLGYEEMEPIKKYIDTNLDHKYLNEIFDTMNPTAELMAEHLFYEFRDLFKHPPALQLSAVIVKTTLETTARYDPK